MARLLSFARGAISSGPLAERPPLTGPLRAPPDSRAPPDHTHSAAEARRVDSSCSRHRGRPLNSIDSQHVSRTTLSTGRMRALARRPPWQLLFAFYEPADADEDPASDNERDLFVGEVTSTGL